ncbi:DUF4321 domain-containing protein [Hydrogenoanaerobacterium sp.]|uniref:DUF4321 domain-containing protein n=1 Tax=Hydrogenoanaerobacterium sp. TaxID=2953763 RepID=UPI00289CE96E|nr:DUF4321 domain-containing protein [Hydrogenoanaerobacterium sp.]
MKWKKNLMLIFMLLAGVIVGALLAKVTTDVPFLGWLSYGNSIGIDVANPMILDLSVLKLAFGFEFGINIAQIICVILSIFMYKGLVNRL